MIIYSATALGIKHLGYLYSKDHEQVTAYRTDIPYRFQLGVFVYRLVRDHSVSGQALIAGCSLPQAYSRFARTKTAEDNRNVYHSSAISNAWLWHVSDSAPVPQATQHVPWPRQLSSPEDRDVVHAFHSRGTIEVDTSITGASLLWRVGRL